MNKLNFLEFKNKHRSVFTFLDYSVCILLSVFIFCTPFPHTTAITNISFYLAILIALFLMIFNSEAFKFKTPLTYPLIIFSLWAVGSIFWALNIENTINDLRKHLLNYIAFYFLLINFFYSRKRLEILAWVFVFSSVIFSVLGMIYYYVIMDNAIQSVRFGFLVNNLDNVSTELPVNFIGILNITAILFCMRFFSQESFRHRRIAIILCTLPLIIATILTQSRGSFVALVIAGITLLLIKKRKLLPVFLVAIAVIIFLTPFKDRLDATSLSERLKINYVTCKVWKDYPLKGIGFGMMTFNNIAHKGGYVAGLPEKYKPMEVNTTHNWLLDIAVRLGVIGLILFLAILFAFVKMFWTIIRYSSDNGIKLWGIHLAIAFLVYFVMGLAEPLFLFTASALIFYILMALMTILFRLNNEAQTVEIQSVEKYISNK